MINSALRCMFSFDTPYFLNELQIHDRRQAARFFDSAHGEAEIAFLRFEFVRFPEGIVKLCADIILFNRSRNLLFILLGIVINEDGVICFPSIFRGLGDQHFERFARQIWQEVASRTPQHLELRKLTKRSLPFETASLTMERVCPGFRDYCTSINHIKRYAFVRNKLVSGRVIDCASGTGYGACMVLQRHDITHYAGVDISSLSTEFAACLVSDDRAKFVCKPLHEVKDGGYENVVSLETIEHVADPHAFLRDLIEKMDPEGQLILSLPVETWHGSHLNPYHLTNWTYARFKRMVEAFFEDVNIYKQRLSLLGPSTFLASPIQDRQANITEDECFVAILRKPKKQNISRIVVKRKGAMGDVVWVTPVVESAARQYPESHVVVVTDCTEVFMGNPHADIVATSKFVASKGDVLIDLDYAYERRRKKHLLSAYSEVVPFPLVSRQPRLYPSSVDYLEIRNHIMKNGLYEKEVDFLVAIHAAATSPDRIWPKGYWKDLLRALSEKNLAFLWVGAKNDWTPEKVGVSQESRSRSVDLVSKTSLTQTAAALSLADVLIAPDSGLSHVAAAVGTPSVVIYSMADPRTRSAFDGSTVSIWADVLCRGCLRDLPPESPPLCRDGNAQCMKTIKPELVYVEVLNVIQRLTPERWKVKTDLMTKEVKNQSSVIPATSPRKSLFAHKKRDETSLHTMNTSYNPSCSNEVSTNVLRSQQGRSNGSKAKLRILVYSIEHPATACPFLRIVSPAIAVHDHVELRWGINLKSASYDPELPEWADIIIFQRFTPGYVPYELIEKCVNSQKPLIYETDDLIFSIPESNPHRAQMEDIKERLLDFLPLVNAVTVPTEEMKKAYAPYHSRIYVLPNLLDKRIRSEPLPKKSPDEPVLIAFAGTNTHREDLFLIEEVLLKISTKFKEHVRFLFFGCWTERIGKMRGATTQKSIINYMQYVQVMRSMAIDIALAPLQNNKFNRCKSNIKWLEYSIFGSSGIYADLPPYTTCVENGKNGILVPYDDEAAWMDAIEMLVKNGQYRRRLAAAAREEVLKFYTTQTRGHLYLDLWETLAYKEFH